MPVQIISRENLWPLPFYLRRLTGVEWWNGVSDEAPSAPVILVTPDLEPALVRKLYDLPPPGERELYVSIFERRGRAAPRVELRGYAAASLWDAFRRRAAEGCREAAASEAAAVELAEATGVRFSHEAMATVVRDPLRPRRRGLRHARRRTPPSSSSTGSSRS